MKVALFGATGFIGKAVADLLASNEYSFISVSRNTAGKNTFRADITDYQSLSAIDEKVDTVILCSSALPKPSYKDDDVPEFIDVNIQGVYNVLRWARDHGARRMIYCSTLSMVPTEGNKDESLLIDTGSHYLYKITKAAGEHLVTGFCKQFGIDCFALRIASVYGRGMKKDIIALIADKVHKNETFVITHPSLTVDFVHVSDVAKAILACVRDTRPNRIINVASGKRVSLKDLAERISAIIGKKLKIEVRAGDALLVPQHSAQSLRDLVGNDTILLEDGLKDLLTEK